MMPVTKQEKQKRWERFEHEVRQLIEAFGYQAETTRPSHDYGVDVIGCNARHKVVIQCKLYGKRVIGGDTVMQLVGSREFFSATDAICITTSRFTKQAVEIAEKQGLFLIDRPTLVLLCRERNLTIPSLTALVASNGQTFRLEVQRYHIGRDASNNLVIADNSVSRRHALLERTELCLALSDCQSTNGTYLNQTRITGSVALNYDDEISIGAHRFRVRLLLATE